MHRFITLILLTVTAFLNSYGTEIDSLISVLDSTIARNKSFMHAKEQRIQSLRELTRKPAMSPEEAYAINTLLYEEYLKYNFDSTLNYINRNLEIANKLQNQEWIHETKFRLSHIFSSSGMYSESLDILESIDENRLPDRQRLDFFSCYQHVYAELGMYTVLKEAAARYRSLSASYRDSLLSGLDHESDEYLLLYEAKLQDMGNFEESRKINSMLLSRTKQVDPEFALYAFQRAISYRIQGNIELQEKYLIQSAIADIKAAVKDNVSLTLLAMILFDNQDIDRAYKYIMFSLEDAKFYNSRLRYIEISRILPLISEAFQVKSEKQKAQLRFYAVVITILAIMLILALMLRYIQMKKLFRARRDLQNANTQLNHLSKDLFRVNAKLKALNQELSESNYRKEEHIGFFLNLCSTYIDKLEDFRKMVHRKVTSGQYEELFNTTKSNHFLDSELKEFYANFDNTFLQLFPDFVEQFNALLMEEEKIVLRVNELLNTELRIFALIRLGITDSSRIASFLRYSVNTIYNYRTRVRNKALVPRDDLEQRVRMIGVSA